MSTAETNRRLSTPEIYKLARASQTRADKLRSVSRFERSWIPKAVAVGVVALAAVVAAGMFRGGSKEAANKNVISTQIAQMIPGPTDPYRELPAGGERYGHHLNTVSSIRNYILWRMKKVHPEHKTYASRDTVTNYLFAQNLNNGATDRTIVQPGQIYKLPVDWGVGKLHQPDIRPKQ